MSNNLCIGNRYLKNTIGVYEGFMILGALC